MKVNPMNKYIVLILALVFPLAGICGDEVAQAYAGDTNMVSDYSSTDAITPSSTGSNTGSKTRQTVALTGSEAISSGGDDDLAFLDDDDEILDVWDPIEPFNRGMFWFNDKLYFYLMKPIARGYRWIAPEPFRVAIGNVFSNLNTPVRVINSAAQGKFGDAGNELVRFGTNSTIGILGMFDPSKEHFGIAEKNEDTGQTLGYYGVGPGPYLVLPFIGPSSFRDGFGHIADTYMELPYYIWEHSDYWYAVVYRAINKLSLDKDTYEGIKKDALYPYLFVRDAWTQYRQNLVEN
jgi:phospholipid-binding lipoprotein MlaA